MNALVVLLAVLAAVLACVALLVWSKPRYIALWQVAGGALILAAWGVAWTQGLDRNWLASTAASALAVASVAIIGGLLLWRSRPAGITVSIVAQVLQIAWISLPRVQLGATLGPTIGPRFTPGGVSLNIGFYGRGGFAVMPEAAFATDVTVNLLAVMAIVALLRLRRLQREVIAQPEHSREIVMPA